MAAADAPFLVLGDKSVPFEPAHGMFAQELTANESMALVVRQAKGAESAANDRLLYLAVQPDARPVVTIRAPAKDLLFSEAVGTVPIEIDGT